MGECGVIDRFGRGAARNSRVNGCKLLASYRLGIIKNSLLVLNEVHLTFDIIFSITSVVTESMKKVKLNPVSIFNLFIQCYTLSLLF